MDWKESLKENITTVKELVDNGYLKVSEDERKELENLSRMFPMSITRHYLSLIDKNDPNDPLRKLCIPSALEFDRNGVLDTSGETENTKVNGLQHKYLPTALMLSTNRCACYCRFCFRKRLVGLTDKEVAKRIEDVTTYVRNHPEIDNVLISGGDSLMNSNMLIEQILDQLTGIESIKYIRFGTRMLSVLPSRILDEEFLEVIKKYNSKKQIYFITHFDHPREITEESIKACSALKSIGAALKNQTVLMRNVNDDPYTMAKLMNAINMCGISPYYIFQCRPVLGVKRQFQVPFVDGIKIIDETRKMLSGPAKSFRYALSHVTGKIEVIGMVDSEHMMFKYHQAKNLEDNARLFIADVSDGKAWLTDEDVKQWTDDK